MRVVPTGLSDVLIIEPSVFSDARGFFFESFNRKRFADAVGREVEFVQDNQSRSVRGVLRGLHYQIEQAQGKLVRAISGEIFDVAVDVRRSSPHFGRWTGHVLSADNKCQLWVPAGFAHGFLVLSETADVLYKTTDYYAPQHERCILYSDPQIGIEWPTREKPILSAKDAAGLVLSQADVFD